MKFGRILLILVIVTVAVMGIVFTFISFTQGPPPVEIAKFNGGNPISSDVTVTDVFQVTEEKWSINLGSSSQFPGWSLEVELYKEWGNSPLRSLKGKMDLGGHVAWELGPGTTEGTFPSPSDYNPDLPPGRYYLKIHWIRITWFIAIYEEPSG